LSRGINGGPRAQGEKAVSQSADMWPGGGNAASLAMMRNPKDRLGDEGPRPGARARCSSAGRTEPSALRKRELPVNVRPE